MDELGDDVQLLVFDKLQVNVCEDVPLGVSVLETPSVGVELSVRVAVDVYARLGDRLGDMVAERVDPNVVDNDNVEVNEVEGDADIVTEALLV